MRYTPYQPLTSEESTFGVAQQTAGQQLQKEQIKSAQKQQRIQQGFSFPFDIARTAQTFFAIKDDETIRNFKLAKAQHDINFEEQINAINFDNTIPSVEKNVRKKQLMEKWRQESDVILNNFESDAYLRENSDFIKTSRIDNEQVYNRSLAKIAEESNQLSAAENAQNRKALIQNIKTVTSVGRVDKERQVLENDINSDKTLDEYQKREMLYNINQIADGQKFDIISKEINDIAFKSPQTALQVLDSQINLLQNNDKYLMALERRVPKIDALQKQRNSLLEALGKDQQKEAAERILSNIDFNDTLVTSQIKMGNNPEYQALSDKARAQVLSMATKTIETLNTNPADFAAQKLNVNPKNMNGYMSIRQKLDQEGYTNKTALPKEAATLFKSTYAALGAEQKDANGVILTNQEKFNRWVEETKLFLGSGENLLKEARLHFDGKDALAIEAQMKGVPLGNDLMNISVRSHAEGKGAGAESKLTPRQKLNSEKSELYYNTLRGKYYSRFDSSIADKEASAFSDLSGITNNTIDKLARQLNGNDGFIIDDKYNIKFDSSLYNESDVKYGIKAVLRNPAEYLTKEQLTQAQKWDLRGGVTAQTGNDGYIVFKLTGAVAEEYQSKTGNPFIARLHLSELPKKPESPIKVGQVKTRFSE